MVELCTECGRILTANHNNGVCRTCELTKNVHFMEFTCPDCGEKLTIWFKEVIHYNPQCFDAWPYLNVELIYHCANCGNDWDSYYTREFGDEGQTALKRHYWG